MPELVAVIHVRVLHIPAAAAFRNDPRMIGSFHRDAAVAVQTVVNIHAPLGIMHIAARTVGAGTHRSAVGSMRLMAVGGCRMSAEGRVARGTGASGMSGTRTARLVASGSTRLRAGTARGPMLRAGATCRDSMLRTGAARGDPMLRAAGGHSMTLRTRRAGRVACGRGGRTMRAAGGCGGVSSRCCRVRRRRRCTLLGLPGH